MQPVIDPATRPAEPLTSAETSRDPGRGRRALLGTRGGMAAMVILASAANAVNYASSLVFSRMLEPVGFGELTSLLALSVLLTVPLGAAQTVVAERVAVAHAAGDDARVRYLIRYALGHVTALGLAVGVVYLISVPFLISALGIRQPGPALALAPLIVFAFVSPVTLGVLQGMERFAAFGILVFATAASRLLFGVPWVVAGGGAGGAIAGQALGLAVVTLLVWWSVRKWLQPRGGGVARQGMRRRVDLHAISASGAFIGFAMLSNFDLVLARVFVDGHEAGIYAAIATVAKVVIFLPSAIAVIMVPSAARSHAATGSGRHVLRRSAAVILGAVVVCLAPAIIAPGLVVDVMFGPGYEDAVAGVLPAVIAGAALAMLYLLATYSVAIRDARWVLLVVVGVAGQALAISLAHGSAVQVAWAQAGVAVAILLANECLFHALVPRPRSS
jgi:O-antigen/teichoic acid export membrane protein